MGLPATLLHALVQDVQPKPAPNYRKHSTAVNACFLCPPVCLHKGQSLLRATMYSNYLCSHVKATTQSMFCFGKDNSVTVYSMAIQPGNLIGSAAASTP
jgi:hypothetical protein